MKILHCFADHGAESDTLSNYGDVIRASIDAHPNDSSIAIQADARNLPFPDSVEFDLGVFHPPCTKWSMMPSADTENAPNLIPAARDAAARYCKDYIIENRANAPLNDPVVLTGPMFGLPIEYKRAFETSFKVEQPRKQKQIAETSPFFYSGRSKEWWAAVKGCSMEYKKQHIAKNTIPNQYINYLFQWYAKADTTPNKEGSVNREKYDNYRNEMDEHRAKEANTQLTEY